MRLDRQRRPPGFSPAGKYFDPALYLKTIA
jgi:hypothetical protein